MSIELVKKFKNGNVTLHSPTKYDKEIEDDNYWIDTYYNDEMTMSDLYLHFDEEERNPYLIDTNKGLVYDLSNVGINNYENILVQLREKLEKEGKIKLMPVVEEWAKAVLDEFLEG